jgi:hypothetical protein
MGQKNLINLGKGKNKNIEKKLPEEKKELSPEEERDLKAKQTVNELLQDVKLTPSKKDDDFFEMVDESNNKGSEWLSEQVTILTKENEILRQKIEISKEDYKRIFAESQEIKTNLGIVDDNVVKAKVIELFNELQNNYISMGINVMGVENFRVRFPAFLERMIMFFPFLKEKKKYKI